MASEEAIELALLIKFIHPASQHFYFLCLAELVDDLDRRITGGEGNEFHRE
jgi:hypothetical protein